MSLLINGRFLTRSATGVERYGRMLLSIIANEWPQSRVLVPGSHQDPLDACGLEVVRLGRTRGHIWEQVELPRAVAPNDVLLSPANTGPLRVARHVPVVHDLAFLHHPEWFEPRFATWYKMLVPRMVRRSERVITVSGRIGEELMRFYGVGQEQLQVVPPFVPAALTMADDPSFSSERPYYLMVGSLDPRKGFDRAFNWYTSLQQPTFDLVIVGRAHRAFAKIALPEHSGIHRLDHVDDQRLASLYRNAIALVQSSYYEGFGLPVLEAMTLGCPVIAGELPVFREQFGDAPFYADIGFTRSMMRGMVTMSQRHTRETCVLKGNVAAQSFYLALDPLLRK
jgi:glycosyltransferase involved in cell wall biosynthesis